MPFLFWRFRTALSVTFVFWFAAKVARVAPRDHKNTPSHHHTINTITPTPTIQPSTIYHLTMTTLLRKLANAIMPSNSNWLAFLSNQKVVDEVAEATDVRNIDADDHVSDADDAVAGRDDVMIEAPVAAATMATPLRRSVRNIDADDYGSDADDDVLVEASVAAATIDTPLRRSKRVALRSGVAPSPHATSG
jgi:hypothetical protein